MAKKQDYETKTEELLVPILNELNFELVDVEYVKEGNDFYLRCFIDKEGGITIDDCETVSRRLEVFLGVMSKIEDLPLIEKPREKAERFGIESLKDEELLAIVINSGTVGHSSLDIAKDILNDCRNLSSLINKPSLYFHRFKGLKKAKATTLLAVSEIAKRINEKQLFIKEEISSSISSNGLFSN